MKKTLLLSALLGFAAVSYAAESTIITATPEGTLHSEVYGSSANTYLIVQGGFGSFTDNDGYCTQIVVNGNDIYVHNIIREYTGISSWIKGTIGTDGIVEFALPQPVAKDPKGSLLYASMLKESTNGTTTTLVPDPENPNLRMSWDGKTLTQILPQSATPSRFNGLIGLTAENGTFMSYGERDVKFTIFNETPAAPAADITTTSYTASYNNEWNEPYTTRVELGIDGETAWLKGLASYIPDAWIKGSVNTDGSITFASAQYLGIYNNYFIYFYAAEDDATTSSIKYNWLDNFTLTKTDNGWQADKYGMVNLGKGHPWFGYGIENLKLSEISNLDPTPQNPEWGEPEWDHNDNMGVGDFFISEVDANGQALDVNNLYYRLFYDGEPAPGDELRKYGTDYDDIMYIGEGWHFALFFEPLKTMGVQAVYKVGDKEYSSEVVTYTFDNGGIGDITAGNAEVISTEYYNLTGARLSEPSGLCIRRSTYADGKVKAEKVIIRK